MQDGEIQMFAGNIIVHPGYSFPENDFAIIRLSENIPDIPTVVVACLPFNDSAENFAGKDLTIVGWGTTQTGEPSENLKFGTVTGLSNAHCSRMFESVFAITENMICAISKDLTTSVCTGDSGGNNRDSNRAVVGKLNLNGIYCFTCW